MEIILKHGCPIALDSMLAGCIFIALPGLLAAIGAGLLQGSFLRIAGGAVGGGLRDLLVLVAVSAGWITVTNSKWEILVSYILVFFGACGGALGSCLAPYRGKLLLMNSAIGGLLGQFCLPFVLFSRKSRH